jgi:hypothetical protein
MFEGDSVEQAKQWVDAWTARQPREEHPDRATRPSLPSRPSRLFSLPGQLARSLMQWID